MSNGENGLSLARVAQGDTSVGTLGPSLVTDVLKNGSNVAIWALAAAEWRESADGDHELAVFDNEAGYEIAASLGIDR